MLNKISFSSLALVNNPFNWAYRLEGLGFTGWEIVCEGNQMLDDKTLPLIRDILETTNLELTLHLPFSDLNLASLNQPIWDETLRQHRQCLNIAKDFIKLAVVHPGHLSPLGMQLPDMAWKQNLSGLQALCTYASDLGILIGVENMINMPYIYGRHAGEILGMIESVSMENIGLTLDFGHANTNDLIDQFLEVDLSKIIHIHLHDNHGKKDEHLSLGKGNIDWRKVLRKLQNFKGRLVAEARTVGEGAESLKYIKECL